MCHGVHTFSERVADYSVTTRHHALRDVFFSQVSTTAPASFQLIAGDAFTCANPGTGNVTGVLAIEATGDGGVWGTTVVPLVTMPEGSYSLKLCIWGGLGTDVDTITFDLVGGLCVLACECLCSECLCSKCLCSECLCSECLWSECLLVCECLCNCFGLRACLGACREDLLACFASVCVVGACFALLFVA